MKPKLLVFDLDDTLIDTFGQMNVGTEWEDLEGLQLLRGAWELLNDSMTRKMLVTTESVAGLQKAKLKKVGIYELFEQVIICNSGEEKRRCFKEIAACNSEAVIWAIGDRIDSEIRHAKEVGWKTVLVKRGKYKDLEPQCELEIPDYSINDIADFRNLF